MWIVYITLYSILKRVIDIFFSHGYSINRPLFIFYQFQKYSEISNIKKISQESKMFTIEKVDDGCNFIFFVSRIKLLNFYKTLFWCGDYFNIKHVLTTF